ncbi:MULTISPECIES: IclR family transcriptional regulator C-terminal domain-containing protein [unclassified Serratia (in: enterobacteria)]|uniref:IclR family transcriptional regulator domain-containing protein n=1 Tax=unclassified Serratia (in: enterobacteria) TaxID=2647522 RepID=UPI00068F864B|nr:MULTISPECIES: IclR family transcriptional regulator C-terminal domain-containing protein [unclassified Serratia (in: enterobacteria)]
MTRPPFTDAPSEDHRFVAGSSNDPFKGDPNFMTSLARGLEVIQAFTPQRRLMSISQISQKTGIPRAAVRRCLYTLNKLGFVYAQDGKNFELRPRILTLGHPYLASTPLAKATQPVLKHISQMLNESCSIATLDGDDILYIARASSSRIMSIDLDIGSRLPAFATSMGRVLLAHLPPEELNSYLRRVNLVRYTQHTLTNVSHLKEELKKVRTQGYAINDQELEIGLRSIAVPLMATNGSVSAALNVGVQAGLVPISELTERVLPVLRDAAQELSLLLS